MKPLSLYIDTSVIGGYFDPEFTIATRELWWQMEKGFNAVNLLQGYPPVSIVNPLELIYD